MSEIVRRNLIPIKAALRKGCFGRTKVYELVAEGKIVAYAQGGQTMVDADSLDVYQASLPRLVPGVRKIGKHRVAAGK
jgi:hypothetical protein